MGQRRSLGSLTLNGCAGEDERAAARKKAVARVKKERIKQQKLKEQVLAEVSPSMHEARSCVAGTVWYGRMVVVCVLDQSKSRLSPMHGPTRTTTI